MILFATFIKCLSWMPNKMEEGAHHLYKFISTSLTWPLGIQLKHLMNVANKIIITGPGIPINLCPSVPTIKNVHAINKPAPISEKSTGNGSWLINRMYILYCRYTWT